MNIKEIKKEIGARIKQFRVQNNWTQEQFSELIDIEQPTLSNIENGKAYPTFTTICCLIERGGIEPNKLFEFFNKNLEYKDKLNEEILNLVKPLPIEIKESIICILKAIK